MLGDTLVPDRASPDEVSQAWRLLLRSAGTAPIAALAAEVGWSERHFTGLAPTPWIDAESRNFQATARYQQATMAS